MLTASCAGVDVEGVDAAAGGAVSDASALTDGDFVIKAVHSGKCVDVASASTQNGAKVQQYACNGSAAQKFRVSPLGNGFYKIVNTNAQKGIDVREASTAPGAQIQIWDYVGGTDQQFAIDALANNEFRIRARHTGYSLEVPGSSQSNSVVLTQAVATSGTNQRFRMEAVGGGSTSCKRGVAYGYHSQADMQALKPGVSWWYNWTTTPDTGDAGVYQGLGVEYVPMIWGGNSPSNTAQQIPSGAKFLLGFNEPNFYSQANLTAQQAAQLWPQIQQIAAANGLAIVSPAVNYCGGGCNQTDPFQYLRDFFAACPSCKVDSVAAHWYACNKDALVWYLGELKQFHKPIWLTEFSCLDSSDTSVAVQQAYMQGALEVLENDPDVFRYSCSRGGSAPTRTSTSWAHRGSSLRSGRYM